MKQVRWIVVALLGWFVLHILVITVDGFTDSIAPVDVAVVLGNKVEKNGTPSARLKSRLDRSVELYNDHLANSIIVSGGVDPFGTNEAKAMHTYLVSKGIPSDKIIEDSLGINSHMTAVNTKAIMKAHGFKSVVIVTQYYHITRTRLAFSKEGIENSKTAHALIIEFRDLYSLVREFIGFYKYVLRY